MSRLPGKRTRSTGRAGRHVSAFARALLREWRHLSLPSAGERVLLAVSGGADSTALLLACAELVGADYLGVRLHVAHLDHELRVETAAADAIWVSELAATLGVPCLTGRADVAARARESGDNLEQAARRARYEFLAAAARDYGARLIMTAHTLDDQAETILLNLLRGSGADGLGGIEALRPLAAADGESLQLVRPLLGWARRADTENYCRARAVAYRTDEMNSDEAFARVRVRTQLLPLLETFNPRAVVGLAHTGALLREDSRALDAVAAELLRTARLAPSSSAGDPPALQIKTLSAAPSALRRRALRQWLNEARGDLRRITSAHLLALDRLILHGRGGGLVELPGGMRVERRKSQIHLHLKKIE